MIVMVLPFSRNPIITELYVYQYSLRPLQFNYLSYELFVDKKYCQTPKKIKVDFGVL